MLTSALSAMRHFSPILAVLCLIGTGCSRKQFRERADRDVAGLITEKNVVPAWKVENWHVYPDERARFADPSKPDFPPYPIDDEAAKQLSPTPQRSGRAGVARFEGEGYFQQIVAWDAANRAEQANDTTTPLPAPSLPVVSDSVSDGKKESYTWALTPTEQAYRLKLDQTVDLGLFNSREFQDRREDLYLAALPVSLERFNFAAQWFANETVVRSMLGRDTDSAGGGQFWRAGTEASVQKKFATGAELIVRLANQIVVDVRDGQPTVSLSTLGLSFTQPLLRDGGFAVTLEALTQTERTLLYAIRSYARFRSVFYHSITAGIDNTNNPYGLQGLSANLGRGVGANLTARPIGYFPTALRAALLANEQKNVTSVEQFLKLFENMKEGGLVPELQVVRVEQRLLTSRALVFRRQQEYLDSVDGFKLQLGVPANLPLELDDGPLRPVRKQLQRFETIFDQLQELEKEASRFDAKEAPASYRDRWTKLLTESPLVKDTAFAATYAETAAALRKKSDEELQKAIFDLQENRRKLLDAKADRQSKKQPESAETIAALEKLEADVDRLRFEQALRRYESRPWVKSPNDKQLGEQAAVFRATLDVGMLVALQARTQRLNAVRAEWPNLLAVTVDDVDLVAASLDDAYMKVAATALANRFDLMNARAQVVDAWRRIGVVANSLRSVFDVSYDLAATTPTGTDRPFAFSSSRVIQQVRLRFEPPFVRRAERNQYRAQLIAYQRQRRNLNAFEDNIVTDARTDLRTVRQLADAYRIQLRAVELAYTQVENARSTLLAPPDPRVQDSAGNIAALTQQLLEAQGQLVSAQNDLYTTWTIYLTARQELLLDMELLTLDSRGQWNDDALTSPATRSAPTEKVGGAAGPESLPALRAEPLPPIRIPVVEPAR